MKMETTPGGCACSDTGKRAPPRPATQEEEAWLQQQDLVLQLADEGLALLATVSPDAEVEERAEDAQVFDIEDERAQWMHAEEEVSAVEEAELIRQMEEKNDVELAELANSKNIECHLMMKSLIQGAKFLVDEASVGRADYQDLVAVQHAARKLLEVIDETVRRKLEEQRLEAIKECNKLKHQQKEIETATAHEHAMFKAEIDQLRREYMDLNEKYEQEKDRTTCRICFVQPRDVLPLPCMHFDYCHVCLNQCQKDRNICPTCRSPISGILMYNLRIG